MPYNILGISTGHNSSACLLSDGEVKHFMEEERLSREKYSANPFKAVIDIVSKNKIDAVAVASTAPHYAEMEWDGNNVWEVLINKYQKKSPQFYYFNLHHHLTHASTALYNSGFKKAIALIIDGAGSSVNINDKKIKEHANVNFILKNSPLFVYETESVFELNENNIKPLYNFYTANDIVRNTKEEKFEISSAVNIAQVYSAVNLYLGFLPLEEGKTMGLSSYGKLNKSIPKLYLNKRGDKNIFDNELPTRANINVISYKEFWENRKITGGFNKFHKDLAFTVQQESQEVVGDLVQSTINNTGITNICCSGGYFLNCVANYYLTKRFPNVNFYFEPISSDAGTSIGAARLLHLKHSPSTLFPKQKVIYYGQQYSTNKLKDSIDNKKNMFKQLKTTPQEIAKLISERNIVCIFQGRSEAGPRALGNRSILYDPTDPNGKDFVNTVKKREWFRPFAGTVLLEKAKDYFDMAGLDESPFMMYAMDVWPDKQNKIPCITHVDGTCRIQTLTKEQNPHYYKLIQEFEKITGIPILFNTSFNLAGDPLVETIEDALETILKSELKYLYLPELEMLLEKK